MKPEIQNELVNCRFCTKANNKDCKSKITHPDKYCYGMEFFELNPVLISYSTACYEAGVKDGEAGDADLLVMFQLYLRGNKLISAREWDYRKVADAFMRGINKK